MLEVVDFGLEEVDSLAESIARFLELGALLLELPARVGEEKRISEQK